MNTARHPQPFGLGRLLLTATAVALLLVAATGAVAVQAATEDFAVSGFDELSFGGSGEMTIIQDGTEALSVRGDADAIERVAVKVDDGRLVVKVDGDRDWLSFFGGPDVQDLHFTLHVKALDQLDLSGAVEVHAERLEVAGDVKLDVSGATDVVIEQLQAADLHVSGSGASNLRIAGSATSLRVRLSGAGDFDAADLVAEDVDIGISGAADASVHATEHLDVRVSGAADVSYRGSPTVSQRVSGAGSVNHVGS